MLGSLACSAGIALLKMLGLQQALPVRILGWLGFSVAKAPSVFDAH